MPSPGHELYMNTDYSEPYHRRSIRLKHYNYALQGAYFVTISTFHRIPLFGEITDGHMYINKYGKVVQLCWEDLPNHFTHVQSDDFVVMPNHIHGIIVFNAKAERARHAVPLQNDDLNQRTFSKPIKGSLSAVVGSFKAIATRQVNSIRGIQTTPVWQRNYYEHIIRNDHDLNLIREYINTNPLRWDHDTENPTENRHISSNFHHSSITI